MTQIQEQPPPTYRQQKEDGWITATDGKIITSKFDQALTPYCTENDVQKYWSGRMMISDEYYTKVDWKIFMKTTSYLSPAQQLFITKHCAGISAIGCNML